MELNYKNPDITVQTIKQGNDLIIRIFGGAAHIGSVAVAEPRKSLTGDGTNSATVSVINYCGHMDDALAVPIAKKVCSYANVNTVVICGVHFDKITQETIDTVKNLVDQIAQDIILGL